MWTFSMSGSRLFGSLSLTIGRLGDDEETPVLETEPVGEPAVYYDEVASEHERSEETPVTVTAQTFGFTQRTPSA